MLVFDFISHVIGNKFEVIYACKTKNCRIVPICRIVDLSNRADLSNRRFVKLCRFVES